MIHISNLHDLSQIQDDPELYREVASYLLYCRHELLEYEDEEDVDEQDFSFSVFQGNDLVRLNDLGSPEESVLTRIECCGQVRIFRRLVYPTEIALFEESPQ